MMKILNQRNLAWSQKKIGETNLTVGRYGCLITCIAMLSSYYGLFRDPEWLAENLKFTKDGLLYWSSCNFENFKFERRVYGQNDYLIKKSLLSNPDTAVVVEVDYSHWVVIIGRDWRGRYRIADPWFGDKALITRYNKITGSAHFVKKHY